MEDALQQLGLGQLEPFLQQNLGRHNAPTSPVVSVVLNILNADLWRQHLGKVDMIHTSVQISINSQIFIDFSGLRMVEVLP